MVFKNKILYCLLLGSYKFCAIEKFSKMENFSIEYMFLMYKKNCGYSKILFTFVWYLLKPILWNL